jgi:DNA helicase II / ATP-dependent DNA helicase PcrA
VSDADLTTARAQAQAAQQQVITACPPFATIACPGAGKTQAIVDRHLSRAVPVRQGRAITSFTRVAAAEVHRRCAAAGRPDLTSHPHFIGTVDTFLWLHLVRPFLPADRIWRRLESWRDAPARSAEFTCGQTWHLADADFGYDPHTDRWSARPAGAAARAARQGQLPASWAWNACRTRADLERAGYLTGTELRARACRNLAAHPSRLGALLAIKYAELVVDEAQDCSAADLYILSQLHDAGLPLVVVADPDQAIYGFRGAASDALASLADRLGRRDLTHNWRSTTVICTLAATLRSDPSRRVPDTAVAVHRDAPYPVLIYAGGNRDRVTADFVGYATTIDISPGNCLVLAHAQATLPKTYTGPAAPPSPKAAALAWAAGIITEYPAAPGRVRNRARDILACTVLRWWYPDADDRTPAECLAAHDVDPAAFERLLHRLATAMPSPDQPMSTWVPAAAAVLSGHPPAAGAARTRNRLVCAGQSSRSTRAVTGLPPAAATGARPRLSTVHQAKGDQAEAVLLFLPGSPVTDRTLTAWLTDTIPGPEVAEALRVLYVGVTRARRLLGLAVPALDRQRLLAHLHHHAIPAEPR